MLKSRSKIDLVNLGRGLFSLPAFLFSLNQDIANKDVNEKYCFTIVNEHRYLATLRSAKSSSFSPNDNAAAAPLIGISIW